MQCLRSREKKSSEGHDRKSKIKSHAKDGKNSKASYKSNAGHTVALRGSKNTKRVWLETEGCEALLER